MSPRQIMLANLVLNCAFVLIFIFVAILLARAYVFQPFLEAMILFFLAGLNMFVGYMATERLAKWGRAIVTGVFLGAALVSFWQFCVLFVLMQLR